MNNKLIREEDGYINATKLGKKKISEWKERKSTKKLLLFCEKYTNICINNLLIIKIGGNHSGTWIHPILACNLAQWISSEFSVKVSLWIEEWKKINNNKFIYDTEILNLKHDYMFQKEKKIQLKLQNELYGEIEVETDSGFIDLLTKKEIIEIKNGKNGKNWKSALGQILVYSINYPKHIKRIHLFDIENDLNINNICKIYDVKVTYE